MSPRSVPLFELENLFDGFAEDPGDLQCQYRRGDAAPGLDGGLVISLRGGDFELTVGQDFSIGYLDHDAEHVRLYIEESFTFLVLSPQAAIPLVAGSGKTPR